MNTYYPNLFQPIEIRNIRFKNRIISSPNFIPYVTADHYPDAEFIRYYEDKAKGGAAAVTVPGGACLDVDKVGGFGPTFIRLDDHSTTRMVELADAIKNHGAVATFQLAHAGLVAPEGYDGGTPMGPSAVTRWDGVEVREMTVADMNVYADSFARGAALLKKCGFDMVQIHGGHGWMQSQFLAPEFNKRTDEYGGSLENRARFPIMIIDRIREAIGDDMLIEYRVSGDEFEKEGYTLEDGVAFCKLIQDKVDILHVSAGRDCTDNGSVITQPTIFLKNGCNVYLAEAVKKAVHIPVLTVGAITTPELAEEIIAEGRADFVAIARGIIADPEFPNKARLGRGDEITPCLRCLNCLTGEHMRNAFHCSVNPSTGHATRFDRYAGKSSNPQRVVVAGGGVAGLKAAITAAERGHSVTLLEKSGSLGGILGFTDHEELKVDLRRYKEYIVNRARKLPIDIRLWTEATPGSVAALRPDALIVAIGSLPAAPPIPGLLEHASHVLDFYSEGDSPTGERVVMLGGGLAGCECAVDLAQRGHRLTIVEMQEALAPDANWMQRQGMLVPIEEYGIEVLTSTICTAVEQGRVKVRTAEGGERVLEADAVLYALGMKSESVKAAALQDSAPTVINVGDCVRPRQVEQAVYEAYFAAVDL